MRLNASIVKDAMTVPYAREWRMLSYEPGSAPLVEARYPIMPPANVSPAPVGSTTFSVGYAGNAATPSLCTSKAPCSPFLMTTKRGPSFSISRPAATVFALPVYNSASS